MTATPNLATGAAAASALAASAEVALAYKQKKSTRHSLNELDAERLEAWEESIEVLRESLLYEDTTQYRAGSALPQHTAISQAVHSVAFVKIMMTQSLTRKQFSCKLTLHF
ncbi:hypothetical protein AC1031_020554 [Aphanomyces cochlioides]|nr:hypothetical protein AC1031_020554 [Aphanomyces cochlioides]